MDWIAGYLNSTYEGSGRGPDKYDCWGLVREARNVHMGLRLLPIFGDVHHDNPREVTRAYLDEARNMVSCEPESGAIAAVMRGIVCIHVALLVEYEGRLMVLETEPDSGPRFIPLDRWQRQYLSVKYWKDQCASTPTS